VLGIEFDGSTASVLQDLHEHIGLGYDFKDESGYNIEVFKKISKTLTLE
jgi:hypothetical protein